MVAMSGWIMPDPLATPTSSTVRPPTSARADAPFGKVSVVPIARATCSQLAGGAAAASASPASALSTGSGTPMTPVEDTNTSSGAQPVIHATLAAIASTASRPAAPVKALALPAFTTSARARPWGSAARHHSTSGEGQRERVVTPATAVPSTKVRSVRSSRAHALYPARTVRAVQPATGGRSGNGRARGEGGRSMRGGLA